MSDPGGPYTTPAPPPVEEPRSRSDEPANVPLWVIVVAGVLALCLFVGTAFMILRPPGRSSTTGPLPTSPRTFPPEWDKRIEPIAEIASRLRGLDFDHPVDVRFLEPAAFEKTLTGDQEEQTKDDKAELEHVTGLLRALGMLSGDIDLQEAVSGFTGGAVLAYYSFEDERITVRGKKITPAIKATLVHELTHVLQDQQFQIGDRLKRLRKESEEGTSSSAAGVLSSIVEGDAERIRYLYQAELTPKQRQVLVAAQNRQSAAARRRTADIPPLVVTQLSSPYVLGPGLVAALAAKDGNGSVNALFEKTPTHDVALFDPYRVVAGQMGATKVAVPKPDEGAEAFESGELGALTWYFMLAAKIPLTDALMAADGWGGDGYVGYDEGSTTCAKLAFAGRTPADTARMRTALQEWASAAAGEQTVTSEGKVVQVASCDPGTGGSAGADTSADAMSLLSVRNSMTGAFVQNKLPVPVAHCIANRLVDSYSLDQLSSTTLGQDPAFQARITQLVQECR